MFSQRLFTPLKLGNVELQHRVIMAPLTRFRANDAHVQTIAKDYYEQRASVPGTFIITEATFISPRAAGYKHAPGIWSEEQVQAWKEIVDAVHAKKSYIYLQLWALGRTANPDVLLEEGGYPLVSSSAVELEPVAGYAGSRTALPAEMTKEDINIFIQDYANAARNAMRAGFDGVEIHGANGYLIDQFWQDTVNQRTDEYGGSVENRARFGLEVTKAVIEAVGDSKKVAIRLSPYSKFQGMGMEDPVPQFLHITKELKKLNLAYLHLIESRISGKSSADAVFKDVNQENDPFINAWDNNSPVLLAGGFNPEKANNIVNEVYPDKDIAAVFGRYFISNPDLPFRVQRQLELNNYDRSKFYGPVTTQGYTDYTFSEEWESHRRGSLVVDGARA